MLNSLDGRTAIFQGTYSFLLKFINSPKAVGKEIYRISLYRNAAFLMMNAVTGMGISFIFWVVVARFYSASELGLASALIASISLLNSISLLGFNFSLIRFLPAEKDPKMLVNCCFSIVGLASIAISIIFISGTSLWSPALSFILQAKNLFALFVIFTAATSLVLMLEQTFIAFRSAGFTLAQQIVYQIIKLILIVVLVPLGAFGIFSAWSVPAVLVLVLGIFFLRKVTQGYLPIPNLNKQAVSKMARFSAGNYFADVLGTVPVYILPLMIVNILGTEPSAYFRIAYGVASILFTIPLAITTSLFAEGSSEPDKLHHNIGRSIKFIAIMLTPAILVVLLLGKKILLIFGAEYSESALSLLWILALSSIPLSALHIYMTTLRVQLKIKKIIYIYACIAIFVLSGSYIAIARIGLIGVGISWISVLGVAAIFASLSMIKELLSRKEVIYD